jgi:hypothetical protein
VVSVHLTRVTPCLLDYGQHTIGEAKAFPSDAGIPVRAA